MPDNKIYFTKINGELTRATPYNTLITVYDGRGRICRMQTAKLHARYHIGRLQRRMRYELTVRQWIIPALERY